MQNIDFLTPLVENCSLTEHGLGEEWSNISLKRLDQNHPHIQGNKAYKLKYNLLAAQERGFQTLLTFGGAWSNHIYSTAAACKELGIKSIGIIRGEKPAQLSPTLQFAERCGMQLDYVSRAEYREKAEPFFRAWLRDTFGSVFIVPEGGSNYLGTQGCTEILQESDTAFDVICCSAGTGATAAGLMLSCQAHQSVAVFAALKGADFLKDEIVHHLTYALGDLEAAETLFSKHTVLTEHHFGGYGKSPKELLDFMMDFEGKSSIALDRIYTSKMLLGLKKEKEKGRWKGEKILAIHTGGLQGGWNGSSVPFLK